MDEPPGPASNIPEYSVSDLSGAVKRTLEGAFGRVRVRGEITECRPYPSGHIYLALKDEGAKVSAVIWKSSVARLKLLPENGVEVIATGRLTTHGERSTYQLTIERLEYAGAGALLARIEALRLRLAAEGLFDAARKRPFPLLPDVVGVVTSERGAVIRDILTTIARRCPRHVVVWPVPVQGSDAALRIAAAIGGFCAAHPRADVLIVARGGGSLEDLMAFNDEAVVRAAATCPIPLISAVGHETDTTLLDFAADRRAPTPTAAAEMAVPLRTSLLADLDQMGARLGGAATRTLQRDRILVERAARGLPDLPGLLGSGRQRVDDRALRLRLALPNLLGQRRAALLRAERGLPDLAGLLASGRQRVDDRALRLRIALPNLLEQRRAALLRAERGLPDLRAVTRQALHRLEAAGARLPAALPLLVARRRDGLAVAAAHLRGGIRHALARHDATAAKVMPRLSDQAVRSRLREVSARLEGLAARLESVSHHEVLARGYAAVFDIAGRPVTRAATIAPRAELTVTFADGSVRVTRPPQARKTVRPGSLL